MRISVERFGDGLRVRMRLDVDRRRWLVTRVAMVLLAVIGVVTGVWALAAPAAWFRSFPFGLNWVPMDGPYNQHLAVDAGAFFLALGVLAALAAAAADSLLCRVTGVGWLVFGIPHLLYHAAHRPADMSGAGFALMLIAAALMVLIAAAAVVAAPRGRVPLRDPAPMDIRLPGRRNG
ncbi:hypothetical protein [Nocardia sp. alder85J]|uniref:hypothetical protein n=1 Tax=Nocardia sp. alder85J TaxID=2862949 RepID=UPI001CD7CCA7|nr:hypothetical protein [Nocardia sp. alder85J]MCX4097427.1 hypothetical protein [Nocardia sp. alder85J]